MVEFQFLNLLDDSPLSILLFCFLFMYFLQESYILLELRFQFTTQLFKDFGCMWNLNFLMPKFFFLMFNFVCFIMYKWPQSLLFLYVVCAQVINICYKTNNSQLGFQKKMLNFLKTPTQSKFGFLFYLNYKNCNGLLYANIFFLIIKNM